MQDNTQDWNDTPVWEEISRKHFVALSAAIAKRARRIADESHPKDPCVNDQDIMQARSEAMAEAIEDWLAKDKDEKWR